MKRALLTLAVGLGLALGTTVLAQHYYGLEGPVPLEIDSHKVMVKFDSSAAAIAQTTIVPDINRIAAMLVDEYAIDGFVVCSLTTTEGYSELLDSLSVMDGIYLVEPYYITEQK